MLLCPDVRPLVIIALALGLAACATVPAAVPKVEIYQVNPICEMGPPTWDQVDYFKPHKDEVFLLKNLVPKVDYGEILSQMDMQGLRPVEWPGILRLGKARPDGQYEFPITTFRRTWLCSDECSPTNPYVYISAEDCSLKVVDAGGEGFRFRTFRFLAYRKQ